MAEEETVIASEKSLEETKAAEITAEKEVEDKESKTDEQEEVAQNGESKDEASEEKKEEKSDSHAEKVAKHYNEHPEDSKESRKDSRIYYLRNFNNWTKSVLINEFLEKIKRHNYRNISVLDLACGKGGDLMKWQRGRIHKLVCADIAEKSIEQCQDRYKELKKTHEERRYRDPMFETDFIVADCSKEQLSEKYKDKDVMFDLTSCQFSFHYSFESYEQADMMMKNACERIKTGGYFIGTTPNAYELVRHVRESEDLSFGNEVYKITFEQKDEFPLFGCKYDFHLEGVVDCPEFLVHFPTLEKMAEKYNMRLVYVKPFRDFFQEKSKDSHSLGLLSRMNALESYPPKHGQAEKKRPDVSDSQYTHARDFVEGLQLAQGSHTVSTSKYRDHREQNQNVVGTLSKDEWDAIGLYLVFAFIKVDPEAEKRKEEEEKRRAEEREERRKKAEEDLKKKEEEKLKNEEEKLKEEEEKLKEEEEKLKEEESESKEKEEEELEKAVDDECKAEDGPSSGDKSPQESRKRKHEQNEDAAEEEPAAKKAEEENE